MSHSRPVLTYTPAMPKEPKAINALSQLVEESSAISKEWNTLNVWWRGASRATWKLIPGVHRRQQGDAYESEILARFSLKAHTRYHHCPAEDDFSGWLFLAQHYRLPTRLLDWSESSVVAAYFACSRNQEEDGILWALNPFALNHKQIGTRFILGATHDKVAPLINAAFGESHAPHTLALFGREVDVRMLVQQGTFSIHGDAQPIEDMPDADTFVRKYVIPAKAKWELQLQLASIGIERHSLFPDLENLARYLSTLHFQ